MHRLQKCEASARKLVDHLTAAASAMRRAVPDGFRCVPVSVSVSVSVSCMSASLVLRHALISSMLPFFSTSSAVWRCPRTQRCTVPEACYCSRTKACRLICTTTCCTYLMLYCISAATSLSQVPSHASCDGSKACHSTRTKARDSPD